MAGSWLGGLGDIYDDFWKMIIRPPRDEYELVDFGPDQFEINGDEFERRDLELLNDRGQKLQCSHFLPFSTTPETPTKLPCVIYLHGNSSSRLEACDVLPVLLPRSITVFCLDLSGSGKSDGEYISLGYHEQEDVRIVVQHLRNSGLVSAIGLWGRSMGAATVVLRAAEDPALAACVMDSPFCDFPMVAEEVISSGTLGLPAFVLRLALQAVRAEVRSRANFDILELVPVRKAPSATVPALFAAAEDDTFVMPHHAEALHDAWGGSDRELVHFTGGHDGERPWCFLDRAGDFLETRLAHAASASADVEGGDCTLCARVAGQDGSSHPSVPTAALVRESQPKKRLEDFTDKEPPVVPISESTNLAADLAVMGFDNDVVAEAVRRHSGIDATLGWLSHLSSLAAHALSALLIRQPTTIRDPGSVVATAEDPARCSHTSPVSVQSQPMTSVGTGSPNGETPEFPTAAHQACNNLAEVLITLGFTRAQANAAAARSTSVEAAVEWILLRDSL